MIVTLTPNPALDLTYHLDAFAVGHSHRAPAPAVRAGGKGINVARVLHSQGESVLVVAPHGGGTGATLQADLDACGLTHRLLEVRAPTRSTIAVATPDATTNLNETGAALSPDEWDDLIEATRRAVAEVHASVLVCSGSMPPQTPPDALTRIVTMAHDAGVPIIVDTSGQHLLAAADAGADVLKPNHTELLAAVPHPHITGAAAQLARRSGGVVYASLGADGLLRVQADAPLLHARLRRTLSGNTTGAGDAAVAALAAALRQGASPEESLRWATAWSAAAVLHPLAGSITDPSGLLTEITIDTHPLAKD